MVQTPSTGKGIVIGIAALVALGLLAFVPSLLVWGVLLVLIAVVAYLVYLLSTGLHQRAADAVSGRRRRGGGGG